MSASSTSTASLNKQIAAAIVLSPHVDKRRIKVKTNGGHVVLCGKTDSWFAKQMAQESLRGIEGIILIDNQLVVEPS